MSRAGTGALNVEVGLGYIAPVDCICEVEKRADGWYRKYYIAVCQAAHDDETPPAPDVMAQPHHDGTEIGSPTAGNMPPLTHAPEVVGLAPVSDPPACCIELIDAAPAPTAPVILRPSMQLREYLDLPHINFSTLKYMERSPLHYQWAVNVGREDTTSLLKFRAIHTAVLEPEEFDKRYVVYPGKTRRGKDWDKFVAAHEGCEIIKADERPKILRMAEMIWEDPVAGEIFAEGEAERAITWTDPRTGLLCKARLDWWNPRVLADLKSGPVNVRIFGAMTVKLLYHAQLAWYSDALALETGLRPPVKFIVAEPEPPHAVGVFVPGEDELAIGREIYEGWLDRVVECERTGLWPGPYPKEEPLILPRYAYADDEMEDGTSVVVDGDGEDE